jgi:uncharacterized protein YcbK (DUF882 family)
MLLQDISRRKLLKLGLITAVSGIIPCRTMAAVRDFLYDERALCIYNLHTKEYLDIVYWKNGGYIPDALREINYIFRDHYNGSVKSIETDLLDLLYSIQQKLQCKQPFHLISGYRSPKTNAKLRRLNKRVAMNSLHIHGKAVDIRLPGHKLKILRRAAYELKGGGVGYYQRANFVHLDVGKVRFWRS